MNNLKIVLTSNYWKLNISIEANDGNHEYQNDKKIMVESIDIFGLKNIGDTSADTFFKSIGNTFTDIERYHLYRWLFKYKIDGLQINNYRPHNNNAFTFCDIFYLILFSLYLKLWFFDVIIKSSYSMSITF